MACVSFVVDVSLLLTEKIAVNKRGTSPSAFKNSRLFASQRPVVPALRVLSVVVGCEYNHGVVKDSSRLQRVGDVLQALIHRLCHRTEYYSVVGLALDVSALIEVFIGRLQRGLCTAW